MAKQGSKRRRTESPTCNSLLLCQDIVESRVTGQRVLQGIVELVRSSTFPAVVGPFAAFMRLSNVYGQQQIRVALQRGDTQESLFAFIATTHPRADPLGVVTSVIAIPPFIIPAAGRYIFSATHDGLEIASSPLFFEQTEE